MRIRIAIPPKPGSALLGLAEPVKGCAVVFDPNDLALLGCVFDDALRELGLVNRNDPSALLVAKCLIGLAQEGVRDPVQLRESAVAAVTTERSLHPPIISSSFGAYQPRHR
jgi:hypothetical protein